jgi:hypothetical protein
MTEHEIEALAEQIANLDASGLDEDCGAKGYALIEHLSDAEVEMVLDRVEQISTDRMFADPRPKTALRLVT